MRLKHTDWKKGEIKGIITTPEDLWSLSQVIEPNDSLRSKTYRKIKIGGEDDRTSNVVRKPVVITIKAEKLNYTAESLRVTGTVSSGPEEIPLGSYHTLALTEGIEFSLIKQNWLTFQKERIIELTKQISNKIIICIHDREEAIIAESTAEGYKTLTKLNGQVQKKYDGNTILKDFYSEISKILSEYNERKNPTHIIIASPAFWKEELAKKMNPDLKKKTVYATCSSVSRNAINEVLSRPETKTALKEDRAAEETNIVNTLLAEISKKGKATYGPKQVKSAAEAGAIESLLITDSLLLDSKEIETKPKKYNYSFFDKIMRQTERNQGKILVINAQNEAGQKLNGLSGIAAILRYPLEF